MTSTTHAAPPGGAPPDTVRAGSPAAWSMALRPRTLWIAVVPILVANGFAWRDHVFDPLLAALSLVVALLMQIITNLQNDVGYTLRGGEHADRVGPRTGLPRATALGLLPVGAVQRAIGVAVVALCAAGLPVALHGGWPAWLVGVASLAAALGYMGGPWPIAYGPLGELVVLVFFGWAAVGATYFVQAHTLTASVALAATATGLFAAAVLALNNHRDAVHDRASGRRTFAALTGPVAARALYGALLLAPFAIVALLALVERRAILTVPALVLPAALLLLSRVRQDPDRAEQTQLLLATVKLQLAFGALLAAAAMLSG
jgi:1,4-dihydroxy-2-naphthoate polyprenyltransferase